MKGGLTLVVVAGVLFTLTAGLSLWLNPGDSSATAKTGQKETGKRSAGDKDTSIKPDVHAPPRGDVPQLGSQLKDDQIRQAQREEQLERQKNQHRFLVGDVRDEMEELQKLIQKAAADTKRRPEPVPDIVPPKPAAPDPRPKSAAADKTKSDTLRAAMNITESMAPENAARILEQMAQSGKIDAAVQLLAKMSPRHAAKVLAAIPDEKLSVQLFEKLVESQQSAPSAGKP